MVNNPFRTPQHEDIGLFEIQALECPFCAKRRLGVYMGYHPHVTCFECGADGPHAAADRSPHEAIVLWNDRRQRGMQPQMVGDGDKRPKPSVRKANKERP